MTASLLTTANTFTMSAGRLEGHLRNWTCWMFTGGLGEFKVIGGVGLHGYTHFDGDNESVYAKMDIATAKATDAAINDLKLLEKAAIHANYLGAKWVSILNIHAVLVIARHGVRMGLERRGIV